MAKYIESALELIGETPLLKLNNYTDRRCPCTRIESWLSNFL